MADENDDIEYLEESDEEKESVIEDDENQDVDPVPRLSKKKNDEDDEEEEEEEEDGEDEDIDDIDDIDDIENEDDLLHTIQPMTDSGEKAAFIGIDNFSDDDEDEDADPNYLQKFDESIHRDVIVEYHPELQTHNYEEIETRCRVVRDANNTIIDPLHKTLPFLSRYEKARVLGERAKQLDSGAKPFVEIDETMLDGYLIACREFEAKKIPFIIKRPLPNGTVEYWRLNDLIVLE
jgi:DNA-directed RNA polymerase I, II, and III subunit RPABC2